MYENTTSQYKSIYLERKKSDLFAFLARPPRRGLLKTLKISISPTIALRSEGTKRWEIEFNH